MDGDASSTTLNLPVIDLGPLLALDATGAGADAVPSPALAEEARRTLDALHRFGILVVRDPRASEADNDAFLDMLERYFGQTAAQKAADVHAELFFQVGATPALTEIPRDHCGRIRAQAGSRDAPLSLCPPERDAKERFMWRIGERPAATKFPGLNAPQVLPAALAVEWPTVMDAWGGRLLGAAVAVAELAALGAGLPRDALARKLRFGPHLLAPTGSDLGHAEFGKVGTILAGLHYDLNFLTAHGRSRFPGLFIWTRDGRKVTVKVPAGCLLVQAGKQLEHLTAGHVLAGFHEVVVTPDTAAAAAAARAAGRSDWRVSSTLFSHVCSDESLAPIGKFAELSGAAERYPPILAGDHVNAELAAINLGEGSTGSRAL